MTANEDRVIFQVIVLELEVVVIKHCEMYQMPLNCTLLNINFIGEF